MALEGPPVVVVVDSDGSAHELSSASEAAWSCDIRSYSSVISVSSTEQIPPASLIRPNTVLSLTSGSPTSAEEIPNSSRVISLEKSSSGVLSGSSVKEITLASSSGPNKENLTYEVIRTKRKNEAWSCDIRCYSNAISVSSAEQIPPATLLRPNTAVSLEKSSADVLSGSSVKEITLASSSGPNRENLAYEVIHKKRIIEGICLCCGCLEVHAQHPLFHGGICAECTERFLERFFLCDEDGYQADCAICCWGETLVLCDDPACIRCFCTKCLDTLVSPGMAEKVKEINPWICVLCLPLDVHGILKKKMKWRAELKRFYDQESVREHSVAVLQNHLWIYQPLSPWERKPINVLSLFDNITQELKNLGFLGKNMGNGRLKYLNDVTDVVRTHIEEWGPFDVIFGSTPALANSYVQPSAWYMYQYDRILQYSRPPERSRPFFWIFLDNLVLEEETRDAACRFLNTEAVVRYKQWDGTIQNVVHIWSNIPSVNSKYSASSLYVDLAQLAEDICRKRIFSDRPASLIKDFLVPLKDYFRTF